MEFIRDDMLFKPYETMGGWQCIMNTKRGKISVRYGSPGLFVTVEYPYEVWYPTDDAPIGNQSAENIWDYIKNIK